MSSSNHYFVNVEGAIYRGDQWLMIMRSAKEGHAAGTLSMPGGTAEYRDSDDKTLEHALRRELKEEVGVTVSDTMRYLESKHFTTDAGEHVMDIVFMAEYASGEAAPISVDEVDSVHWMTISEILAHPKTPPWIRQSMLLAEAARTTS